MYQFFVEPGQIQGKRVTITGSDVNHIKNVLRMRIGEEIAVSNGMDGLEYRCGIEEFLEDEVVCTLRFVKEDGLELPSRIYLFQALPKGDKMELVIQKAVELGAFAVIPVAAKRCVVKLDAKKEKNKLARWQGISEAAAKQSKRLIIPEVTEVMNFSQACALASSFDRNFIPYELAQGMEQTRQEFQKISPGMEAGIFIGPEGGFAPEEIALAGARLAACATVSLGPRILRAETAALAALSIIMYERGFT